MYAVEADEEQVASLTSRSLGKPDPMVFPSPDLKAQTPEQCVRPKDLKCAVDSRVRLEHVKDIGSQET